MVLNFQDNPENQVLFIFDNSLKIEIWTWIPSIYVELKLHF